MRIERQQETRENFPKRLCDEAALLIMALRIGLLLAVGFVLLGGLIDYTFYNDRFALFVIIRSIAIALLAGMFVVCGTSLVYRIPYTLSFFTVFILCLFLGVMINLTGGVDSHYYQGFGFILFTAAILKPGAAQKLLGLFLIMVAVYIVTCLGSDSPLLGGQDRTFLNKLGILTAVFCVSLALNIGIARIPGFYLSQISQQKRISQQKLKERHQKSENFFFNIIHELRNELALITLPLECIQRKNELIPEELSRHVKTAYNNSRHLFKISEELLRFGRTKDHSLVLSPEPIDLGMFLSEMIDVIRPLAEEKGLLSHFTPKSKHTVIIEGDRDLLRKALLNLLSNAVKFTPQGGEINVSFGIAKNKAFIEIKDNGRGIPQEDLEHIFERFYQSSCNAYSQEGSGIGLALTREIINKHEGSIYGKSDPNKGTIFTLYLPVIKDEKDNFLPDRDKTDNGSSESNKNLSKNLFMGDSSSSRIKNTGETILPKLT